jgi:exosortase D (VPLPA-CTERM-specific)
MENPSTSRDRWHIGIALAILAGAFCLQYHTVFGNLVRRWNSEDFEYCYLVPFIFLYLLYTNRESLKGHERSPALSGLIVIGFSGVLYLAGQLGSMETLTYVGIWMAVIGLSLTLCGPGMTKNLAFPLLVLAFIVPLPPFLNRLFTFKLKLLSSALSVKMMQASGLSVFREGNIVDLGLTQLQVVDACSGLRYVYPLVFMGLLFGYFFQKKWWERLVVLFATIPIAVFSNALRIAITGYLSKKVSPDMADSFFHSFSGWLIFMVSLGFLLCLSGLLRVIRPAHAKGAPERLEQRRPPPRPFDLNQLKPSYVWMASVLFFFFWGLNATFASALIRPSRTSFEKFPTRIGDWIGERTLLREEILDALWADDYVQIRFTHLSTRDVLWLFAPYYEYQGTRHTAHSPVSCLVGSGFAPASRTVLGRNWPPTFGQVEIRQMVLARDGELLLSNYWFQQRGRVIVSEFANKWFLFWDSLTRRRTDGALVRLEMPLKQGRDIRQAQGVMDAFTRELVRILPQYIPG